MTLLPADRRSVGVERRDGSQSDALIDDYIASDPAGFADDDAGSVVDEETGLNFRSGVDIDAALGVGVFAHDAGNDGHSLNVQIVRNAVNGGRLHKRITENHLREVQRRRIAVVAGVDVFH